MGAGQVARVDVVVVAFGPEPLLGRCVDSILSSSGVDVRVLLVDNGCTNPDLVAIRSRTSVRYVDPGGNVGLSGGVAAAEPHFDAPLLALVNSDVVLEPDALQRLAARLEDEGVGIVMPLVTRMTDGRVNSRGNPLHLLGYSWAGGNGEPAERVAPDDVAVASGAVMALRRSTWRLLGGLPEPFFLYHEDVDLSVACHQFGLRVVLEPSAIAQHHYEWGRNDRKLELAERNRLAFVLTRYPRGLIARLLPLLILVEAAAVVAGGVPGARRAKLRGYLWLIRNRGWVIRRRRANLRATPRPLGMVPFLTLRFDASAPMAGAATRLLDLVTPGYARLVGLSRLREPGVAFPERSRQGDDER